MEEYRQWQHLENTAELAEGFALVPFKSIAREIGIGHDIGKNSQAFRNISYFIMYCIARHHSGLPDGGTEADLEDKPSLAGRLKRRTEDYYEYQNQITLEKLETSALLEFF